MTKHLTKIVLAMLLCSPITLANFENEFPNNLYCELNSEQNADVVYELFLNNQPLQKIALHAEQLKKSPIFYAELEDIEENFPRYFTSQAEITAFKRLIYFLYKNDLAIEAAEIEDLCKLSAKYAVDALGQKIRDDLKGQVQAQKANASTACLLDSLTKEQFKTLVSTLDGMANPKTWMAEILATVFDYISMRRLRDDEKFYKFYKLFPANDDMRTAIKKRTEQVDPNEVKLLLIDRKKTEFRASQQQAANKAADAKAAKTAQVLDARTARLNAKADRIIARVGTKALKFDASNDNFLYSTLVWHKDAHRVSEILRHQLPEYRVKHHNTYWEPREHLWCLDCVQNPRYPVRLWTHNPPPGLGCCLATGIGSIFQMLCYPLQVLSCHWCRCGCTDPNDNAVCDGCFCSTEAGACAAGTAYGAMYCCHQWITIEAK